MLPRWAILYGARRYEEGLVAAVTTITQSGEAVNYELGEDAQGRVVLTERGWRRQLSDGGTVDLFLAEALAVVAKDAPRRCDAIDRHREAVKAARGRLAGRLVDELADAACLLDAGDVGDVAGVVAQTVRNYLDRGYIPPATAYLGASPLWSRRQVDEWIASRPGRGWKATRPQS